MDRYEIRVYGTDLGYEYVKAKDGNIILYSDHEKAIQDAIEHADDFGADCERLKKENERLREYAQHKDSCEASRWADPWNVKAMRHCDCGLDSLIKGDSTDGLA